MVASSASVSSGFAIGAAQRPEVVQHDMNGDIKGWLAGASGVWLRMTQLHDAKISMRQTGQGVPIRAPRQRPDSL